MLREEDARGRFTGECAKNDVGGPGGQPFKGPSGAARVPPPRPAASCLHVASFGLKDVHPDQKTTRSQPRAPRV